MGKTKVALKVIVVIIIMLFCVFVIKKFFYKDYNYFTIKNQSLTYNIKFKGLEEAIDFVVDPYENMYICYNDRIQYISKQGKSYYIIKDKDLRITSIEYFENKLYFTSKTKLYCYDLNKKVLNVLVKDLPNYGDYKDSVIKIYNGYLYLSIGATTNSGVVGADNKWLLENPYVYDISPKTITLKGLSFGEDKTSAFQSFKTKSVKGQIVPEHYPGNGSILLYNLSTGNNETFAWGIRNVTAMDFNKEGKLYAGVGGMEDRGLRAIKGDNDYIYQINKDTWYGWPDYSGGDPVNSPKFKGNGNNKIQFILENHASTNPPAPFYQHKKVGVLGSIAIDNNGSLGAKDIIYFNDNGNNNLYSLNNLGMVKEEGTFSLNSKIKAMKIYKNSLLVLDGKLGYLYNIDKATIKSNYFINNNLIVYLIITGILGIVIILKYYRE